MHNQSINQPVSQSCIIQNIQSEWQ